MPETNRFCRLGSFEGHAVGGGLRIAAVEEAGETRFDLELCVSGGGDADRARLRFVAEGGDVRRFVTEVERLCAAIEPMSGRARLGGSIVGIVASLPATPRAPV